MNNGLLVTGANGFLGSNYIKQCVSDPDNQIIAIWHSKNDCILKNPPNHINYVQCDLTNINEVKKLFNEWKIKQVLHTAALIPDNKTDFLTRAALSNITATANLVECAGNHGCERIIYCSSTSVYGPELVDEKGWKENIHIQPNSVYGWSKFAGEECVRLVCKQAGLIGVSLRLSGIHGPGRKGGVISNMINAARNNMQIHVSDAENRFQLLFIDDAVNVIKTVLINQMAGSFHCINVASHIVPSLKHLAESIILKLTSDSEIKLDKTISNTEHIMDTSELFKLPGISFPDFDFRLLQVINSLKG